jgi:predicted Zn-dependent peptidase
MLSAVRSPCRVAATKAAINPRKFATVVESSGLKVAAVDNGQPSASVTLLVKAGSRHESKAGLAHALKNYAFKVGSTRPSKPNSAKQFGPDTFLDFLIEHK